jgi:hypothetical protein
MLTHETSTFLGKINKIHVTIVIFHNVISWQITAWTYKYDIGHMMTRQYTVLGHKLGLFNTETCCFTTTFMHTVG